MDVAFFTPLIPSPGSRIGFGSFPKTLLIFRFRVMMNRLKKSPKLTQKEAPMSYIPVFLKSLFEPKYKNVVAKDFPDDSIVLEAVMDLKTEVGKKKVRFQNRVPYAINEDCVIVPRHRYGAHSASMIETAFESGQPLRIRIISLEEQRWDRPMLIIRRELPPWPTPIIAAHDGNILCNCNQSAISNAFLEEQLRKYHAIFKNECRMLDVDRRLKDFQHRSLSRKNSN